MGTLDLGVQGGRRTRKSIYGKTQGEVRDKLRSLQRVVEAGAVPAPANLIVGGFLDIWLREFLPGTVSPRTEDIYRNIVKMYLVPTVGSIKLAKLTPAHVSRMLTNLEGRGYAPETRRKARAILRRALRRAEQEGIVTRNVAAIADGPRVPRRKGRTLTPDQAKTFLNAVKGDRLEAAYIVALALGLRRGELLGISWGDLELDGPMPLVRIRRQLLRHQGQGVPLSELKTAGSKRTLYLSRPVVEALRRTGPVRRQSARGHGSGAIRPTWCSRRLSAHRSIRRSSESRCRGCARRRVSGTGASMSSGTRVRRSCLRWGCRSRWCPTRSGTR